MAKRISCFWSSSCGRIELAIAPEWAAAAHHQGECYYDVLELMKRPEIEEQLEKLEPELVAGILREYGAWDGIDLEDHQANLTRLLWIACGDIVEEQKTKEA